MANEQSRGGNEVCGLTAGSLAAEKPPSEGTRSPVLRPVTTEETSGLISTFVA